MLTRKFRDLKSSLQLITITSNEPLNTETHKTTVAQKCHGNFNLFTAIFNFSSNKPQVHCRLFLIRQHFERAGKHINSSLAGKICEGDRTLWAEMFCEWMNDNFIYTWLKTSV